MDIFSNTNYDWTDFLMVTILLLLVYIGLRILKLLLDRFNLLGRFQKSIHLSLQYILLIFEPLAVLVLAGGFIMAAPLMNGLIVLLLLILGGNYFKNYIAGRFISRDNSLKKGKRLAVNEIEGIIYEAERFGVQLQTERGRHFLSYSKMLKDGYTILSGDEVGGIFHLKITGKDSDKKVNHKENLLDLLAGAPYLDRIQKPVLENSGKNPNRLNARITLREASHLSDFRRLLNDWGYESKILKNK